MRLGLKFNEILAKYGGYLSEITKRNLGVVGSKLWLGVTYPSSSSVLNRFFTLIVQYAAEGGFMLECRTGPDSVFRLGLLAVWGCMY